MRNTQCSLGLYDNDIYSPNMYAIAEEIKGLLGNTKETKRRIGALLQQVRNHLKQDKEFGKWRSLNFNDQLPQPTAFNYMTLASFPEDTGNIPESALYILGREENKLVRDEVFDKLKTKKKVTLQDMNDAIADAKGEPRRTRKAAMHENNQQRINTMWRELSNMDGYYVEQLVELIGDKFGASNVREWVKEKSPTPAPPAPPLQAQPPAAKQPAAQPWALQKPAESAEPPAWAQQASRTAV